jgi:hypothetical protein
MIFGIDISSDCIAASTLNNETTSDYIEYGVIGVLPRYNERIIWNNPKAVRSSSKGSYVSLTDMWYRLINNDPENEDALKGKARFEFETYNGNKNQLPVENLIAEAIHQNLKYSDQSRSVVCIDNKTNEFQQESLLKGFKYQGYTNIELLWRPIALCLYILKEADPGTFSENEKIAIVDFDGIIPEVTLLSLKYMRDELVPVRSLPSKDHWFNGEYNSKDLKREFLKYVINDEYTFEQLECGPFSKDLFSFFDNGERKDIYLRKDLFYEKYEYDKDWIKQISNYSLKDHSFQSLQKVIRDMDEYRSADYKFWHGFPCRIQERSIFEDGEILIEENTAVAVGAADYGLRMSKNLPTYYDTLPGLEIFSNVEGGGHHFFKLIKAGEVEGGKTVRIPEPISRFLLEKDTDVFSSILRYISNGETKILKTAIPSHDYDETVPLTINAEMKSANGHAMVTIEGQEGYEDIFGDRRRIRLDWNTMEPYEIKDNYSGPEVYPVRGRIGDDEECRNIVREHVSNSAGMYFSYTYRNRQVKYQVLHGPWGYFDPWGSPLGEPTRAMFGAHLEEDDEIQVLSDGVSKLIYDFETNIKNRHKYLNYMFRYAPESFREELRNLYSSENPDLNWNTVYGVGRVFYKTTDFELFVDFFLKKSEQYGYPAYPDGGYTDKYIWAFFRCLCYYEETNLIPLEKAEKVIKCIINFSATPGSRQRNTPKFILSAILFSLRFRTNSRAFLSAGTQLRLDVEDLIQNTLPQIDYPPAMFSDVRPDKLNDFVFRFLNEEQKDEDIEALKGLITSMS